MDYSIGDFFSSVIKLFALLTPPAALSAFLSGTQTYGGRRKRRTALRTGTAVFIVGTVLYFFGESLFSVFGFTLDAFRIGAGALLFLTSVALMGEQRESHTPDSPDEDISVVPLAIPICMGPASIGTLMVLGAFQIVLLYLFGNSIIATDMFTNLVTTNPGEAGELLSNIYPSVILVCVMYLPLLWFAAREIGHKRQISRTTRMNVGLTGAVLMALGMLALWPAYRVSEDRHVLRDEIFPLNVLYNVHLSATEFCKAYNFEETSEDFTYGASRTAQAPGREIYVYVIGEASRAMNWQLYGYDRETNPRLSQVDDLIVFRDMLTQSNTTTRACR